MIQETTFLNRREAVISLRRRALLADPNVLINDIFNATFKATADDGSCTLSLKFVDTYGTEFLDRVAFEISTTDETSLMEVLFDPNAGGTDAILTDWAIANSASLESIHYIEIVAVTGVIYRGRGAASSNTDDYGVIPTGTTFPIETAIDAGALATYPVYTAGLKIGIGQ